MDYKNISALPPSGALSYVGDAVHSLYVRKMLIGKGICKSGELNKAALLYVTAEAQAVMLEKIEPHLTEEEAGVVKRAFNSTHLNKPKHASGKEYRMASGFEAVLGMLYLTGDHDRLDTLLGIAHMTEE